MDRVTASLIAAGEGILDLAPELLAATLLFLVFAVLGAALGSGLGRMLELGGRRNRYAHLLSRAVRAGFVLVGLILGLQVLGLTALATSLLATGGLVAVILGFAFREIGENLLAGIFLGISRSFEIGDLIESSGHRGQVREIDLRQVWIRSDDGRDIFIPSAEIFRNVLINYTRDDLRRADFALGFDYAGDMDAARELLLETVREVEHVLADPPPTVRLAEFQSQYVELKVMIWVNTDDGPGLGVVRSAAMAACLRAVKNAGFALSADVTSSIAIEGETPG